MNWLIVRKLWSGLAVLTIMGIGFILVGEPALERKQVADVNAFLQSLPGEFSAGHVSANFLTKSVTISNLNGTVKSGDGTENKVSAGEITLVGLNSEATSDNGAPLFEQGEATHLSLSTIDNRGGEGLPRTITVERISFHNLSGNAAGVPGHEQDAAALLSYLETLRVSALNIQALADTETTQIGTISVDAQALSFEAGADGHGAVANIDRFMLPGILKAEVGTVSDRQTIRQGLDDFSTSGGAVAISLHPDGPISMRQLQEQGGVSLNAEVNISSLR